MPYLLLSIVAMVALALVLRTAMAAGADALGVNLVLRATAAITATAPLVLLLEPSELGRLGAAVAGSVAAGSVLFFLAGVGSIKAVQLGPLGLSWAVLRCSMVIPVVASVCVWREVPLWPLSLLLLLRAAGVAAAAMAIVLMGRARGGVAQGTEGPSAGGPSSGGRSWRLWLGLAFVAQGAWEIVLRATRDLPDDRARALFLAGAFAGAALLSGGSVRWARTRIGRRELAFGLAAGVLGALASGSRVWALRAVDGVVLFPVTTVSVMVLVQVTGTVLWREPAGALTWLGLGLAAVSVCMLSLPAGI